MSLESILQLAVGGGVSGVFCVLFILGFIYPRGVVTDLKAEIAELKGERTAERDRADAAVAAAEATKEIMRALAAAREPRAPTGA